MLNLRKKSKAFTLVELIIVVVIIGILGAVSVVGYTNQAAKAQRNAVLSNLTESVQAMNACIGAGDRLITVADETDFPNALICNPAIPGGTAVVTAKWPTVANIAKGWSYTAGAVGANGIAPSIVVSDGGVYTVTCSNAGCAKGGTGTW
jgi:prepilin-type N-terminal cleavage/methylation domain-containing protein